MVLAGKQGDSSSMARCPCTAWGGLLPCRPYVPPCILPSRSTTQGMFPCQCAKARVRPKPCATSSEALPPSPTPALDNQLGSVTLAPLSHPTHCHRHSLKTTGAVRSSCWSNAVEASWQREVGTGKITAELQPTALRQGKTICFQVYFILHCTLLIKWTCNPFEKPHGAQIHLANLSFPPGAYLD